MYSLLFAIIVAFIVLGIWKFKKQENYTYVYVPKDIGKNIETIPSDVPNYIDSGFTGMSYTD
jgi:hypothetical protein